MSADDRLLRLVGDGHELMARERSALAGGDFRGLAALAAEKSVLLGALEVAMGRVRGTAQIRTAISDLIADSRRNERIILAARQGLAAARRSVESIIAASRGAVAYDRDGSTITSWDDALRRNSRA